MESWERPDFRRAAIYVLIGCIALGVAMVGFGIRSYRIQSPIES